MRKLLISLDDLLDTRLGILFDLNPTACGKLLRDNRYWDREGDHWGILTNGEITDEAFKEAWATRSNDMLKRCTGTSIFMPLANVLGTYQRNMAESMVTEDLAVEVNIHPYTFDEEEQDALREVIRQWTYQDLVITFCNGPLETLTPSVLFNTYDGVIMYEFHRWIKQHAFGLNNCPQPDFTMIVPRLFEKDPSDLDEKQKQEEILGFRLWLRAHVDVEFIEPRYFSMFRPQVGEAKETDKKTSP